MKARLKTQLLGGANRGTICTCDDILAGQTTYSAWQSCCFMPTHAVAALKKLSNYSPHDIYKIAALSLKQVCPARRSIQG